MQACIQTMLITEAAHVHMVRYSEVNYICTFRDVPEFPNVSKIVEKFKWKKTQQLIRFKVCICTPNCNINLWIWLKEKIPSKNKSNMYRECERHFTQNWWGLVFTCRMLEVWCHGRKVGRARGTRRCLCSQTHCAGTTGTKTHNLYQN